MFYPNLYFSKIYNIRRIGGRRREGENFLKYLMEGSKDVKEEERSSGKKQC
jgi:hypothetical protein